MLKNTIKDNIKNALLNAGYRDSVHNIEMLYTAYMSGTGDGRYGQLVRDYKYALKR